MGFKDCKSAIDETKGDIEKSIELLRKKGIAKASKKMSRVAAEGLVLLCERNGNIATIEINSETDFVAKSEEFKDAAKQIAMHIAAMKPTYLNIDEVPESKVNEEKDIIKKQSENEGKSQEVIDKIVDGKITSFYSDTVLNEQIFCNPELYEGTVGNMIDEMSGKLGEKIYIKQFSHIEIGT